MAQRSTVPFLRDLRYRLEYLGLRFLIGMVRLFPIDLAASVPPSVRQVRHFRQILLWPLRLVALRRGDDVQRRPWELLG